eukprot:GHVU01218172.1.p1 GENE.GHVU01218172.1~~GHVU01218172.1.p1  ORF type:complete len:266 (+),score=18.13 GHVU01218172.1:274-1071(+)
MTIGEGGIAAVVVPSLSGSGILFERANDVVSDSDLSAEPMAVIGGGSALGHSSSSRITSDSNVDSPAPPRYAGRHTRLAFVPLQEGDFAEYGHCKGNLCVLRCMYAVFICVFIATLELYWGQRFPQHPNVAPADIHRYLLLPGSSRRVQSSQVLRNRPPTGPPVAAGTGRGSGGTCEEEVHKCEQEQGNCPSDILFSFPTSGGDDSLPAGQEFSERSPPSIAKSESGNIDRRRRPNARSTDLALFVFVTVVAICIVHASDLILFI